MPLSPAHYTRSRIKRHLKRNLPFWTYNFLAKRSGAWLRARQISSWRAEQIAITQEAEAPQMASSERESFLSELKQCETYLEYGSGGSTLVALKMVPNVVSVENDREFSTVGFGSPVH